MIIQMMGPQACGKGTQGEKLSEHLGLPLITVGQLLRDIPKEHPQHSLIQDQMKRGVLVDYAATACIIKERISNPDCNNGYILDGWGRILDQFPYFDPQPNWVVHIWIPESETIRRISGRRYCTSDGKMYNINTLPKEELAKCKGEFVQRPDDTEEAIKVRLNIYKEETIPVVDNYKSQGILLDVDGMGTPEEVFARVLDVLAKAQAKLPL